MYEPPSRDKPLHSVWRVLAIIVFVGLFSLGVAMVFHHPGRRKPAANEASQPNLADEQGDIPRAESVEEGLTFTDEQQEVISAVRDHSGEIGEPGFYLLLRHTASLPKLSDEQFSDLASPNYADLLEYPSRYRGRPLRMRIYPKTIKKLIPGHGLDRSRYWPPDRPVWRIDGFNPAADPPEQEPVVVISTVDPVALLGEPTSVSQDGRMAYEPHFTIEVACVFHKVWTTQSSGDEYIESKQMDYPVVFAWQLRHVPTEGSRLPGDTLQALIMFLVVALLLILFFYMRRRNREQPEPPLRYRPRRREMPSEDDLESDETDEVDPELRAAADAARKHRTDDDADRES